LTIRRRRICAGAAWRGSDGTPAATLTLFSPTPALVHSSAQSSTVISPTVVAPIDSMSILSDRLMLSFAMNHAFHYFRSIVDVDGKEITRPWLT
jgi:hypothetical protein